MSVLFPDPVAPTTASDSPAASVNEMSRSTQPRSSAPGYWNETPSIVMARGPADGGRWTGSSASTMVGTALKTSLIRVIEAAPRCTRVTAQPSAIIGQMSWARYIPKATKAPRVIVPAITWRPPTQRMMMAPPPPIIPSRGWNTPEILASARFRRWYSSLSRSNSRVSACSCR